jgi:hypothetical protein
MHGSDYLIPVKFDAGPSVLGAANRTINKAGHFFQ